MTGFEPTTSVIITLPKAMCYRCEYIYIYWLALALPFIISYMYSILIFVNWKDSTEVGSNI